MHENSEINIHAKIILKGTVQLILKCQDNTTKSAFYIGFFWKLTFIFFDQVIGD